ncbi:MAG: YihY/virulence factor BrkB family protein, partial [Gemmatimonadota bacterium]|nr:YihY/virulence factor BrkB family protein [Gemmatimonadota bacterium]
IAGLVWDPQDVQRALETQFAGLVGSQGARGIHEMISQADRPGTGGVVATVLSVAGLLFGATGAFIALQGALNHAWEVKPDPKQGGIKNFVTKRILSVGMVLGIGFLMAVSLALTAGVSALGGMLGGGLAEPVLHAVNFVVSFGVLTVLFAAIYKVLPDAEIGWRDVWVGAIATALLFVAGKFALGLYLGRSEPGSAFGAAGALAIILVWVYYAGMILLFGAEFTQRWAERRGAGIRPEKGAVRVEEQEVEKRGAARGYPPRTGAAAREMRPDQTPRRSVRSAAEDESARRAQHDTAHTAGRRHDRMSRIANDRFDAEVERADGNGGAGRETGAQQSIGELFKRLSGDATHLIQQEVTLAKTELRQAGATLTRDAAKIGIAVGLALPGVFALTAFLVIGLGDLLNNYWVAALIVGVLFLAIGGFLVNRAVADIKRRGLTPEATIETVREDAVWAKREMRELKQNVRS